MTTEYKTIAEIAKLSALSENFLRGQTAAAS
jgi:hypothetical protein